MSPLLIAAFLITALLYASVGFGGGSTYNALLVLSGADYRVMPLIALVCNMIVVCGGIWRFARTGDLSARRLLPFLANRAHPFSNGLLGMTTLTVSWPRSMV